MKGGITLTTNVAFSTASNIFLKNEVFFVSGPDGKDESYPVAVSMWSVRDCAPVESLNITLSCAIDSLRAVRSSDEFWLIIATPVAQIDTKILRHRKLTGWLESSGVDIEGLKFREEIRSCKGGIRFFGISRLEKFDMLKMPNILLRQKAAYLVSPPLGFDQDDLFSFDWLGDIRKDVDFVREFVRTGGIVLKNFGEFDDRDRGVFAFTNEFQTAAISKSRLK